MPEEKVVFYCYEPSSELIGYNIEVTDDFKVEVRVYAQSKICHKISNAANTGWVMGID